MLGIFTSWESRFLRTMFRHDPTKPGIMWLSKAPATPYDRLGRRPFAGTQLDCLGYMG